MDLFSTVNIKDLQGTPLAELMRPTRLEDFVGQQGVVGNGSALQKMLERESLLSMVLWGPPGCGKTTLAKLLSGSVKSRFIEINAVDSGAKKIKEIGESSKILRRSQQQQTVVFVDEIHRFNKSQQDVLLPFVESGDFTLIGATTENPAYYLNRALISRCRVFEFLQLEESDLERILSRTMQHLKVDATEVLDEEAQRYLLNYSDGDARRLLNAIETLQVAWGDGPLGAEAVGELLGTQVLPHDKDSDQHYDLISAFIKSIRGSDPDAAIYYLARMLEGGEDPRFIARRLVVLASEDVGNADPKALGIAIDGARAVELIGMPEVRINLAQVTTYLASAPKSNRSYRAIDDAIQKVRETGSLPVPKALRSSKTALMKSFGYGKGYKYSHDGAKGFVAQDFLPEEVKNCRFYEPVEHGYEKHIKEYLSWLRSSTCE